MAIPSPSSPPAPPRPATSPRWWARWRPDQQWEAYLFLLPSFCGLLLFVILPVLGSLTLSFFDWNLLSTPNFAGVNNYTQLLTQDRVFRTVFWNTLYFSITIVPVQLALGLALAVTLNQAIRGITFYRLVYFMPVVTNIVAAALVFKWLFNHDFGLISAAIWGLDALTGLALSPPDWLNSTVWAKPAVVVLTVWKNVGFTMIIYLAGLQGIPSELYNAAKVDGANAWQRFRHITIPLVSPTTFFLLVIQMIGAFQLFSEPFVMFQDGGPAQAALAMVQYIYQNAFRFGRMGKAAAIAWVLFALIFLFTFIQNRWQRRWVYYEAEE